MTQEILNTATARLSQLHDGVFPLAGTLAALTVLITLAAAWGSI